LTLVDVACDLGQDDAMREISREPVKIQPRLARHLPPLLATDGLLVVETDARTEPELPLPVRTSRRYGQTRVTLFEAQP